MRVCVYARECMIIIALFHKKTSILSDNRGRNGPKVNFLWYTYDRGFILSVASMYIVLQKLAKSHSESRYLSCLLMTQ